MSAGLAEHSGAARFNFRSRKSRCAEGWWCRRLKAHTNGPQSGSVLRNRKAAGQEHEPEVGTARGGEGCIRIKNTKRSRPRRPVPCFICATDTPRGAPGATTWKPPCGGCAGHYSCHPGRAVFHGESRDPGALSETAETESSRSRFCDALARFFSSPRRRLRSGPG